MGHPATPNLQKLPFWRTVAESYKLTFGNIRTLLQMSWPLLLALLPVSAVIRWIAWPLTQPKHPHPGFVEWALGFSHNLVMLAVGAAIAVPWHRFILFNEKTPVTQSPWDDARTKAYIGLGLLLLMITEFGAALRSAGILATNDRLLNSSETNELLIFLLLTVRWSLAFPAIAIGRESQPRSDSWDATKGNYWRMFWGGILTMVIPIVIILTLAAHTEGKLTQNTFAALSGLFTVVWMFVGMSYVTFLSLAYRHFFGPIEVEAAASTPPNPHPSPRAGDARSER